MRLELGKIKINDVQFGPRTMVDSGCLLINKEELLSRLRDERLAKIEAELARPGESVRIMPVKDVIEPRVKVKGPGGIFPGFVSKAETVGEGRTHVLAGAAVVTTGRIVGFQEGIIDMQGPGACYSPFSKTCNLVLISEAAEGLPQHEHEAAVRLLGLKAAAYLGEAAQSLTPDQVEVWDCSPLPNALKGYPGLPRVAYVYMLQSQGLLHDTYVYGMDAKKLLPTFLYPTEVMDGAIISGNCVSACDKNTTFHHQNNPVIHELLDRHGRDLNFIGVVVTNENVTLADKQRSSDFTAKLVEWLGVDGVIISKEGFGNPDADLMMNCVKLEQRGIKAVLITDEFAGRDGASQSLADAHDLANAVVSAGNANQVITLPPMERVLGCLGSAEMVAGGWAGSRQADGGIEIEIQAVIGATNELGFSFLTAREV
ncbi:MAG: glycine/sarcosine/betaine reductase component B subunit [Bacillota bacterium]